MNREPEEVAIQTALARWRPVAVPAELAARLEGIPEEVGPPRPLAIRLAISLAPWALLTAAGLVLAFGPVLLARDQATAGASAPDGWTAAAPGGGFAEVSWFGLPWVPLLIVFAILEAASAVWSAVRKERRAPSPAWTARLRTFPGQLSVSVALIFVLNLVSDSDPIVYGSVYGPGPEVSETQTGAHWFDEKDPSGWGMTLGGPHYVYRVRPGESFSYIISVRNEWPLPIRLLGVSPPDERTQAVIDDGVDFVPTGLGLLSDPAVVSAERGRVVPFHPVVLAPGEEVALVVAATAESCANPAAEADPPDPPGVTWADNRRVDFVYEIAAWRRVGTTTPPFGLTVPVTEGCMRLL